MFEACECVSVSTQPGTQNPEALSLLKQDLHTCVCVCVICEIRQHKSVTTMQNKVCFYEKDMLRDKRTNSVLFVSWSSVCN